MNALSTHETGVLDALGTVDDPEYPGVSIVDLGLVESVAVDNTGACVVGLIPTFSGCPALSVIERDVRAALAGVSGVAEVEVRWLTNPAWSVDRVSPAARATLAKEFTVAVALTDRSARCPQCGGPVSEQSMFGPSRCRAVYTCASCTEVIEVMRS